MPKLAIYIPKTEMREIDKWRKKINFSRVFMQALQQEIQRRSRSLEVGQDKLEAAASHYRRELSADATPLSEFGYQLGSSHVLDCRLQTGEIRRLLRAAEGDLSGEDIAVADKAISADMAKAESFAREHEFTEETCPDWRRIVLSGYVQGVADAWREVCRKMASLENGPSGV
jgi:hypothetical protein